MSEAFESFLRGEDRLAHLLCALPAYTPSAEFETAFARAAQAAQAARDAIHTEIVPVQTTAPSPVTPDAARLDAVPSAFEPPASLEASFRKMAASIESAQTPRRDALLSGIAKGDSPQAMLGAAIAPRSEEWLRAQATATAQPQPAQPIQSAPPSPPAKKHTFLGFRWFDLRLAALACVLAVVGTQLVLMHSPEPQQVAMQEGFERSGAPRDQSNEADLARETEAPLAGTQLALGQNDIAMPQAQRDKAKRAVREAEAVPALKKSAAGASAPHTRLADATDSPQPASSSPARASLAQPGSAAVSETVEGRAQPLASEVARPAVLASGMAEKARADTLSAPPAQTAASLMPAPADSREKTAPGGFPDSRKEEAFARQRTTGEIAPQEANQVERRMAAEKSVGTAAGKPHAALPAAAPTARRSEADAGISATLADDPARIAARLPARPAGAVWTVYSSQPRQPELDRWLETLRQHMPETSRPARFDQIKDDASPGANHLRIVPPALPETR